jgi:hypothetical protein
MAASASLASERGESRGTSRLIDSSTSPEPPPPASAFRAFSSDGDPFTREPSFEQGSTSGRFISGCAAYDFSICS